MKELESWEYDVLEIYNVERYGPLDIWFDFLKNEVPKLNGDVLEAGVWRGRSLLSAGIVLEKYAENKHVYGYDTFGGFPNNANNLDDPSNFNTLFQKKLISPAHFERIKKNLEHIEFKIGSKPTHKNISSSGDFSETSVKFIEDKIKYFNLKNVSLVGGPFSQTMKTQFHGSLSAVLIDCDLYESYWSVFDFVWNALSIGGMIYLDEFYSLKFPGARIASLEFLERVGDAAELHHIIDNYNGFERWWVIKTKSIEI